MNIPCKITILFPFIASLCLSAKAPNFILIYADDLGYADTSVQMMDAEPSTKNAFIQTPGIERLAQIGSRFTAAYSPSPTCTASRISIQMASRPPRFSTEMFLMFCPKFSVQMGMKLKLPWRKCSRSRERIILPLILARDVVLWDDLTKLGMI